MTQKTQITKCKNAKMQKRKFYINSEASAKWQGLLLTEVERTKVRL